MKQPDTTQRDTELALLGVILGQWPQAEGLLHLTDNLFTDENLKKLYVLLNIYKETNRPFDRIALRADLEAKGGDDYAIYEVENCVFTPDEARGYADYLISSAKTRAMQNALIYAQSHLEEDPLLIMKKIQYRLDQLEGLRAPRVLGSSIDEEVEKYKNTVFIPPKSTGLSTLDNLLGGGIRREEMTVLGAPPGAGKALDLSTKIPTPFGFTTMGDIAIGDKVFDENGNICTVIGATPVMEGRPCYRTTFSDGTQVICDANHQWLTRDEKARQSTSRKERYRDENGEVKKFGTNQSYKKTHPHIVTTEQISQTLRYGKDNRVNHAVKNCQPINLPSLSLPIDPYVLSSWLGDGSSASGTITGIDEEIFDEMRKAGYTVNKHVSQYSYGIIGLQNKLRELNLLNNKHIPATYLRASYEQRLSLLQGLMDTDGHCDKKGTCEFVSMKENLARQVKELVCSLGIKATLRIGDAKLSGVSHGPKYRVCFTTNKEVFRLSRKQNRIRLVNRDTQNYRYIVSCEPVESVPVRCIEVDSPSHLYLCTDSFIPTHNSALAANIAFTIANTNGHTAFFSKEMLNGKIVARLLASTTETRVGAYEDHKSGKRRLSDEELADLELGLDRLSEPRKHFHFFDLEDSPIINPNIIRSEIRGVNHDLLAEGNETISLVVIDYLQILDFESDKSGSNLAHELGNLAKELHQIALSEHCHILVLSAVGRALANTLSLDAIRDSGAINYNVDNTLLMVKRNDLNTDTCGEGWSGEHKILSPLVIRAPKVRNGEDGKTDYLAFAGIYQKTRDTTPYEKEQLEQLILAEGGAPTRGRSH